MNADEQKKVKDFYDNRYAADRVNGIPVLISVEEGKEISRLGSEVRKFACEQLKLPKDLAKIVAEYSYFVHKEDIHHLW